MNANSMIFTLEGVIADGRSDGFFSRATATDAKPRQRANTWLECMKVILRQPGYRDRTDWTIAGDVTITDGGTASIIDAEGGLVIGCILEDIQTGGDLTVFMLADSTTQTLDGVSCDWGGEGGDGTESFGIKLPAAASATDPSHTFVVFPNGLLCINQIEIMADDEEGASITANDVRALVVYSQTLTRVGV